MANGLCPDDVMVEDWRMEMHELRVCTVCLSPSLSASELELSCSSSNSSSSLHPIIPMSIWP
jgi:hypothetical protein